MNIKVSVGWKFKEVREPTRMRQASFPLVAAFRVSSLHAVVLMKEAVPYVAARDLHAPL